MITYELEAKQIFQELLGTLTLLLYVSTLKLIYNDNVEEIKKEVDEFIQQFYTLRLSRVSSTSNTEEENQVILRALNSVVDEFKKSVYTSLNISTYKEKDVTTS